jgi:acrylyl-CoA reductase (NADPH)
MTQRFKAIVAEEHDGGSSASLQQLDAAALPEGDVLIGVAHSALNYKDALAVTGAGKICRSFPMVCGVDLAGTVLESRDPACRVGERVVVNGFGLSERHWGGLAQLARVKAAWPVRIPDAFSTEQAMAIGTAGLTAMFCVQALEAHGVGPGNGPVLVTGASGGVGSLAVLLLAKLGYHVVAATGRVDSSREFLTRLGAREIIPRAELARPCKPLESERWAGAIDSVGGETLATVLAQTRYRGTVAACGLAGGTGLPTTVMPFILRGVTLAGIDSNMASRERREHAWRRLADLVDPTLLRTLYAVRPIAAVPTLCKALLAGEVRGRIVIDVNA